VKEKEKDIKEKESQYSSYSSSYDERIEELE
jgi:hypothetical protein